MPYQPCSVGSVAPTVDTPIVDACVQSTNSLLADVIGERPTGGEKGACRIARLIEEDLISSGWATGTACPSEQSIAKRFGTGRSSVRGAVRILEVRGVARMIPGPKGGLRVLGLDSEHTIGAVVGFARFLGTGTAELDEARRTRLAVAIRGFEQVLITAAVLDDVPEELTGNTVHISRGTIVEQEQS